MSNQVLKYTLVFLVCISSLQAWSQESQEIHREWVAFYQKIAVQTNEKVNFKLKAHLKTQGSKPNSAATLYTWIKNNTNEDGFSQSVSDTVLADPKWTSYQIEGHFDKNADTLFVGGWVVSDGDFYFDDFQLYFQKKGEPYKQVPISNADFEQVVNNGDIPGWLQDTNKAKEIIKVKGYTFDTTKEAFEGTSALWIRGRDVQKDTSNYITAKEGVSPQIGVLIAMLNNLSNRVERVVKDLDLRQTDHLLDEKANRIGALIMHLAAAEKWYQNLTFEHRKFNDQETEQWMTGLDLGEKAREKFVGKPISYYLDIYKEVRKKTIEELEKRNDKWLEGSWPGATMNNHFAWFHVMEHQSSHLGQILMLKKRIPKEENNIQLPKEEMDQ